MYSRKGKACRVRWGNSKERGHLDGPSIDKRIIIKQILEKQFGQV
jgi:hypothetical protein